MSTADPGYNPTALGGASLVETSGPTTLTLGSIADGLAVKRTGTTLVGYAPGAAVLIETSGPDTLTLGSITDGLTLKRVGSEIVGYTPAAGGGAPTTATYIVQTADAGLSAEQALGALATGILKSTTTTGVLSIAVAGTDYVIPGADAPKDAQFLTLATNATLTVERVFTPSTGLTAVDAGAGGAYTLTSDALTGLAGGQTLNGGTASGENLTLQSTVHATKGKVYLGAGTTAYVDATAGNPRVVVDGTGLTTTPPARFVNGKTNSGVEVGVSGTVASGFTLLDSSAVLKGAFGYAVSANDWLTGTGAGDTVVGFVSGKKLQIGILAAAAPMVTVSSVGLGISQTTPATLLHVGSATPTTALLTLQASGGTWSVGNGGISGGDGHFDIYGGGGHGLLISKSLGGDILGGQATYIGAVVVGDITANPLGRLWVKATRSMLPAAGSVYNMVDFAASTVTLDQGNGADITTATGFNAFMVRAPTYSNALVARVITNAATQAISGAPIAGANVTITNNYALWIQAGNLRLDGKLSVPTAQTQATIGANGAAAALTALPVGFIKVDINGAAMIVPYYNP